MGQFYHAAKAFDVLERLDPNPEYWEGKRGACVGVFQMIIAGHEPRYVLIWSKYFCSYREYSFICRVGCWCYMNTMFAFMLLACFAVVLTCSSVLNCL